MARTTTKSAATEPEAASAAQPTPESTQSELVTLTGRLTADPVLRRTQSGIPVANFRIAVNHEDGATFTNIVAWKRTAETVAQYMRNGRLVEVRGFERSRTWADKDGNERHVGRDQRRERAVPQPHAAGREARGGKRRIAASAVESPAGCAYACPAGTYVHRRI